MFGNKFNEWNALSTIQKNCLQTKIFIVISQLLYTISVEVGYISRLCLWENFLFTDILKKKEWLFN